MDKNIYDAIDNTKPSDEQKKNIYHGILDKKTSKTHSKRLLALTSICILLLTTGMVIYNKLDMNFLTFLDNKSVYEPESLESYIYDVNKTIVDKNGDLTIKQVLGDENITYVFMELKSKNGQVFNISNDVNYDGPQEYWFDNYDYNIDRLFGTQHLSGGIGLRMLKTKNPDSLGIVASIISNNKNYKNGSVGYKYSFEFKDLIENPGDEENSKLILPGTWKGNISLKHKLIPSKDYSINKTIEAYNTDFYMKNIKLSPLSMTIYSNIDKESFSIIEREMNKNSKSLETFNIMDEDFFIKTKDGKLHKLILDSGLADHLSSEMVLTFTFSDPIELSEIDSIRILGQDIPFK